MAKIFRSPKTVSTSLLMKLISLLFLFFSSSILQLVAASGRKNERDLSKFDYKLLKFPKNPSYDADLFKAIRDHRTSAIADLIFLGANPHAVDQDNMPALHFAAYKQFTDIIRVLVQEGADIELLYNNRYTPLAYSVQQGLTRSVQQLLRLGANAQVIDPEGRSLLHMAAAFGHLKIIEMLSETGINLELKDFEGTTALAMAENKNHTKSLQKLISLGADIHTEVQFFIHKKVFKYSLLFQACRLGHIENIAILLAAGANVSATAVDGSTPLHFAAVSNNPIEVIRMLVNAGAPLEAKNKRGDTPLVRTIDQNKTENIKELIRLGANIHTVIGEGVTLLHIAGRLGYTDILKILAEAGINLERKNDAGYTALADAENVNKIESVKSLIALGANVNTEVFYDDHINTMTLLGQASSFGHLENVKMLIAAGAVVDRVDSENRTPFYWASAKNFHDIMKVLAKAGADVNRKSGQGLTPLHYAARQNNVTTLELLVQLGADLEAKSTTDQASPLFHAADFNPQMIRHLVRLGANIDATAGDGETALLKSIFAEKTESVEILIQLGADVNKEFNIPALDLVVNAISVALTQNRLDYVILLLAAGAKEPPKKSFFGERKILTSVGIVLLSILGVKYIYPAIKRWQLSKELIRQNALQQIAAINQRNNQILRALNEILNEFYPEDRWRLLENHQFQLRKPSNPLEPDSIPVNEFWSIFKAKLEIPNLEKRVDVTDQHLTLTLNREDITYHPIQVSIIKQAIKAELTSFIQQQPKYKLWLFQQNISRLAVEIATLKNDTTSFFIRVQNAVILTKEVLLNQERILRRLQGQDPIEIPAIEKILKLLNQCLVLPVQSPPFQSEDFLTGIQELEKQVLTLHGSKHNEHQLADLKLQLASHKLTLSGFLKCKAELTTFFDNLPLLSKDYLLKLDNAITAHLEQKQEELNAAARASASTLRLQSTLFQKKEFAKQQHLQAQQARSQHKEAWEKKQEEDRLLLQQRQEEELKKERAKAATATVTSSSSSSSSSYFYQYTDQLKQIIISLGDLLQGYLSDHEGRDSLDYKYAVLSECLRLFEVVKQSNQHPIAKQIRNALMHNHRYIDLESLVNFVEIIAHAPTGSRENALKLEDALRTEKIYSLYGRRLQQALTDLRETELYRTQAKSESEIPVARTYIESISHLLDDLAHIKIKDVAILADFPHKIIAIKGIMICIGECQQQLRNKFDVNSPIIRRFIICKRNSPDLKEFIITSENLRQRMGHDRNEINISGSKLQSYQREASLWKQRFDNAMLMQISTSTQNKITTNKL